MKYVYPAVVYNIKGYDSLVLVMPDVNIVVDGDSIEEIMHEASEQLKVYLKCVSKFGATIISPMTEDELNNKYKGEKFVDITCELDEGEDDNITFLF